MSIKKPMNKIEKLIDELCPDGVEFRELEEVGVLIGGSGLPKTDFTDSGVGCIHYGQIYTYYGIYSNQTISFVSEASATKLKKVKQGDIIIAKTSENVEDICKSVAYLGVDDIVTGGHTAIFKHKQNSKYLSYYINGAKEFQVQKRKVTIGVKVIDVSLKNLAKIKIPIPPLTIQKEIVKILDNFTQLEAELEAELEARKKQYEHYREALLSFDDGVEFRELGEVGKFLRGSAITAKETTAGEIPVVANAPKPIYFHGDSNRTGETIVIARSGAYCGLVSFWNQPIFLTDAFSIYLETTLLKAKFIYYFLKKNQKTIHSMKKGYGVPHVRVKDFESYSVPIPPLAEQKRIVAILDKFDALVSDISMGLPAEISARKKQYEYYRNQLLSFKPLPVCVRTRTGREKQDAR